MKIEWLTRKDGVITSYIAFGKVHGYMTLGQGATRHEAFQDALTCVPIKAR